MKKSENVPLQILREMDFQIQLYGGCIVIVAPLVKNIKLQDSKQKIWKIRHVQAPVKLKSSADTLKKDKKR